MMTNRLLVYCRVHIKLRYHRIRTISKATNTSAINALTHLLSMGFIAYAGVAVAAGLVVKGRYLFAAAVLIIALILNALLLVVSCGCCC